MDGTAWIAATRESLPVLANLSIQSRLMLVASDLSAGFMVVAYERINPGLRLVALCSCAEEAPALIDSHDPTHLIICSDLESGDGPELTTKIKKEHPSRRVMLISRSLRTEGLHSAWDAGCEVLALRRKTGGGRLLDAYRTLFTEGAFCDPDLQARFLQKGNPNHDDFVEALTPREQEVVLEVVYGMSNVQISTRLGIAEATVKRHLHQIMQKLGVSNRAHLATRALRLGCCSWGRADNGPPLWNLNRNQS